MGYTPNNNPYIPGDPYSYDLKWMVAEIKKKFKTVEDGSITFEKLSPDVAAILHSVEDMIQYNVAEIGLENLDIKSNSVVYFPRGIYEIDPDAPILASSVENVKFIGDNAVIKLKSQSSIESDKTYNLMHFIQCHNIEISGLTFDGNRDHLGIAVTDKTNEYMCGIFMRDCSGFSIHDNQFRKINSFGIYSKDIVGGVYTNHNISDIAIFNNYFTECMNAAKIIEGISENISFRDNLCEQMDTHGISFYPTATNVTVTGNVIEAGVLGAYIAEGGSGIRFYETNNIACTGNIILSAYQAGILVEKKPVSPVLANNVVISQNIIISDEAQYGIKCSAENAIISENIIRKIPYCGIRVDGSFIEVKNNQLISVAASTTSNIIIEADSSSVIGNKLSDAGHFGIDIQSGYTGIEVKDNTIVGGATLERGIILQSNCIVGENTIKNASVYNILQLATDTTYTTNKAVLAAYIDLPANTADGIYNLKFDQLAPDFTVDCGGTLMASNAFIDAPLASGSLRFRTAINGTTINYDLAPNITAGNTSSLTAKKKGTYTNSAANTPYFSSGDVLTVQCVVTGIGSAAVRCLVMLYLDFDRL